MTASIRRTCRGEVVANASLTPAAFASLQLALAPRRVQRVDEVLTFSATVTGTSTSGGGVGVGRRASKFIGRIGVLVTLSVLASSLAVLATQEVAAAATLPPGFQEEVVFSGLTEPTTVRFSPDGRVFVAEKSGLIKVFDSLTDTTPDRLRRLADQGPQLLGSGPARPGPCPGLPGEPVGVRALHLRRCHRGHGAALGFGERHVDDCPTPRARPTTAAWSRGRLSRLQAAGNVMVGSEQVLHRRLVPAVSEPLDRQPGLRCRRRSLRERRRRRQLQLRRLRAGRRARRTRAATRPAASAAQAPPAAEGGALRSQDVRTTGDPAGLNGASCGVDPATGAGLPDNPIGVEQRPQRPTDRRATACATRSASRSVRGPTRSGSVTWAGATGRRSTGWSARPAAPVDNFGWPCYEGDGRQGGYDAANLSICENLYAEGTARSSAPYFRYHHNDLVVPNDICPKGGSSVAGTSFAFSSGGSLPGRIPRRAVLRRLHPPVHLGHPHRRQRAARHLEAQDVRRRRRSSRSTSRSGPAATSSTSTSAARSGASGTSTRTSRRSPSLPRTRRAGRRPSPSPSTAPASSDPDGDRSAYAWDLDGDGAFDDGTAATASYTYTQPGTYTATLRVTDPSGATGTSSVAISAGNTPPTAVDRHPDCRHDVEGGRRHRLLRPRHR